ncbi:MAG: 30S ribosomal protein S18 [Phycisphaerales bacterium]|nr:30S ribosomal protein S18 [Phycisphaerales bacterium]
MQRRRSRRAKVVRQDVKGNPWVDYKDVDELRRMMTPNGKIYSRKRLGTTASEQRRIAKAIKRARFMGLLPYTSGTV